MSLVNRQGPWGYQLCMRVPILLDGLHCGCHLITDNNVRHFIIKNRSESRGRPCHCNSILMMKALQLWQQAANDKQNSSRLTERVKPGQVLNIYDSQL